MKSIKNRKIIYIVLSIAVLIANILPIIIFRQRAAITIYSIPSLVFAFCSAVYAIIAFLYKGHGNLFVLGKDKLFIAFLRSFFALPSHFIYRSRFLPRVIIQHLRQRFL